MFGPYEPPASLCSASPFCSAKRGGFAAAPAAGPLACPGRWRYLRHLAPLSLVSWALRKGRATARVGSTVWSREGSVSASYGSTRCRSKSSSLASGASAGESKDVINAVHCRLIGFRLFLINVREHGRLKGKGEGEDGAGVGVSCPGRTTLAPRASVSWAGRKGRASARAVHPHPNPLPSRERGCYARQVPACAGMTGGCAGLSSCFTLSPGSSPGQALTLSHRGERGMFAPGTAPLGYRRLTAATSRTGRLAAVALSSRVFGSVRAARNCLLFRRSRGARR